MDPFSSKVEDTLCVGQRRPCIDTDERVLLFLKMRPGHKFSHRLATEIRDAIRSGLSPRHVPAWIGEVEDIPVRMFIGCFDNTELDLLFVILVHRQWKESGDCC